MNDMLCSPPMTAHLFTQTYPPRLKPMLGRPRSRTAPPTPLAEAPETEYVELTGSFPLDTKPFYQGSQSGSVAHPLAHTENTAKAGADTLRSHSGSHELLCASLKDVHRNSLRQSAFPGSNPGCSKSPHHTSTSFRREVPSYRSAEDTLVPPKRELLSLSTKQPIYSPLSATTPQSLSIPPSRCKY